MGRSSIRWPPVVVAVVVQQVIGTVWYGTLADAWMASVGITLADIEAAGGAGAPLPYLLAVAFSLTSTLLLAVLIGRSDNPGPMTGLAWAFALWACLLLPYDWHHDAFALAPIAGTAIDSGKDLLGLLATGVILGVWHRRTPTRSTT